MEMTQCRCKFTCMSVTKRKSYSGNGFEYDSKFQVVTCGSEENKNFYKFTPCGSLELSTHKADIFVVGQEYYLDIVVAKENEK